jgi:hypothetical protein
VKAILDKAGRNPNKDIHYLKGLLAEDWHAYTLKTSAIAKGYDDLWAEVPNNNSPTDIRYGDGVSEFKAQVKYYKSAENTAKEISQPKYCDHAKVVPADQLDGVKAAAEREAIRNTETRPDQAYHYKDTAQHADDSLKYQNASSSPLTEPDSKKLATDARKGDVDNEKYGLVPENFVHWNDVFREAGEAAVYAMCLSASIKIAPHLWSVTCRFMKEGEIDRSDLLVRGKDVLYGTGSAGLRGGVAAVLTAGCRSGLLGSPLKNIPPQCIGAASVLALNALQYAVELQQGKISRKEMANNCIRDTLVLASAWAGSTMGQVLIPIPVIGALAGSIIGSTFGVVAYQGVNRFMLGLCAESGWTFFGLVHQDYTVPEEILIQCGYDIIPVQSFPTSSFSQGDFVVGSFSTGSMDFIPVKRGILSCNAVGYI